MAVAAGEDNGRSVNVKLTADVSAYLDGMERAKQATRELREELEACGITEAEMAAAIKTTLKLVKDDEAKTA